MGGKSFFAAITSLCLLLPLGATSKTNLAVDSLMERTFGYVGRNNLSIRHTEAFIYFKFFMETRRHNIATRLIPFVDRMERGNHRYIGESVVKIYYTHPNIIDKKEIAFYTTMPYMRNLRDLFIASTSLSVYEPTLLRDRLLSPVNRCNKRYYRYDSIASIGDSAHQHLRRIQIRPRFNNTQLVTGSVDIDKKTGQVYRFDFSFQYNTLNIRVEGNMMEKGNASLLPSDIRVTYHFNFLKNYVGTVMYAHFNHTMIKSQRPTVIDSLLKKHGHDLTFLNRLNTDTTITDHNIEYFNTFRPYPLTAEEDSTYTAYQKQQQERTHRKAESKRQRNALSDNIEDLLLGSHYIRLGSNDLLRFPPLITPSMIEWSNHKGLSLRTRLRFTRTMNEGCSFTANFYLGYNFRHNEFYWKTPAEWCFAPRRDGHFTFEIGNGNRIYNSEQAEQVRKQLSVNLNYDSLLNIFDRYAFNYYNDYYIKIGSAYEVANGLNARLGLVYHVRRLIGWNEEASLHGITHRFTSLAPTLHLEWTPGLYYYWRNNRKQPLFSKWPTFSLDYERGIPVPRGSTQYERWETEAKWRLNFSALRCLYLRAGGGFYTKKKNTYFVDYANFKYNSLPETWLDGMTGQFESLDQRWYNESRYYARACASYESPMLLFSRLPEITKFIKRERIYVNLLSVHALNPYIETGYGVSTHLFDAGLFIGTAGHSGTTIGWKFLLRFFEDN